MNIEGIINVSGKSGLYKIISQGKNAIIVESLKDKRKMPVYPHNEASSLEDIGIYTYEESVPLMNIFKKIAEKENYQKCMSHQSSKNEIEDYFREILPDYDEMRVYISDMKKTLNWYNILQSTGFIELPKDNKNDK